MRKLVLLLALLLTACVEEELPISVVKINTPQRWSNGGTTYTPNVKIVAKDNVTIKQVILNRGNCQAPWNEQAAKPQEATNTCSPKTDAFGNSTTVCTHTDSLGKTTVCTQTQFDVHPADTHAENSKTVCVVTHYPFDEEMYVGLGGVRLPKSLKFGEAVTLQVNCDVLEAKVETDRGSSTFTWK